MIKHKNHLGKSLYRLIFTLFALFSAGNIYAGTATYENYPFPVVDYSYGTKYEGFFNSSNFPNYYAFAALKEDGTITAWGNSSYGGSGAPTDTGFIKIYSNAYAFAALKEDGTITAWGNSSYGGSGAPSDSGFINIYSTERAFAALKEDGTIATWGDTTNGENKNFSDAGYTKIYTVHHAFAALKEDGSIVAWGNSSNGGSGAPTGTGFKEIYSTANAFLALKEDGSISVWGNSSFGGSGAPIDTKFSKIYSNSYAFAALKEDGSIVVWGDSNNGGSGAPTDTEFTNISSSEKAFAALKEDGSIVAWGDSSYGGAGAPTGIGYKKIYSNNYAFAALKEDGSIVVWGNSQYGGSEAPTDSGYKKIYSNQYAFAALKEDGSIVAWGDSSYGGSGAPTDNGYIKIFSNKDTFTAYKADGTIYSWGVGASGAPAKVAPMQDTNPTVSQTLKITPVSTNINAGETAQMNIEINDAENLYATQATVKIDKPNMLNLTAITYGDLFDKDNRLEIPNEAGALSQATNEKFSIAISLKNPASPITGSGTFAKMSYKAPITAYGTVTLTPENVIFSDKTGMVLENNAIGATITIHNPIFTENGNTVSGTVTFPSGVDMSGVIVTLENSNGDTYTTTVDENGNFTITDLQDGTYTIYADQSPYFSQCSLITVQDSQVVNIEALTMISGDINVDGIIDIGDVTLVANYFGENTTEIPSSDTGVDVNNDGVVNIQDLAIIGANFGMARCQQ